MAIEMTCENCAEPFFCYKSEAAKGRKYCSLACRSAHRFNKELPSDGRTLVNFQCVECAQPFTMMRSYYAAYLKKFDRDPLYCSTACTAKARREAADKKNKAICKNCGIEFRKNRRPGSNTIYREQTVCSKQCKNEWVSKVYRKKNGAPEISKRIRRGYVVLRIPASGGKSVRHILEHRYVMEQLLGRPLTTAENPHHLNGQRADNRPENLELWSRAQPPGQRVVDKVDFAIEMLRLYPEFAAKAGVKLVDC